MGTACLLFTESRYGFSFLTKTLYQFSENSRNETSAVNIWHRSYKSIRSFGKSRAVTYSFDMILAEDEFAQLVTEAIDSLPDFFKGKMENVAVLVQLWPSEEELKRAGVAPTHTLLGLYNGVPLTQRTQGYHTVPPDTITLYQGTIEMRAGHDLEALRYWVRHVFLHELAHHFGISDDRLRELGAY